MTAGGSWAATERALVTRARWRVSLLVAVAETVLICLVGGTAYGLLVRGQQVQIDRELAFSAQRNDPASSPGCTWLFLRSGERLVIGSGRPPPGFPQLAVMARVARTGATVRSAVRRDGTVYHVLTQPRGTDVVQAVFDARYQLGDRRLLLVMMLVVELVGLLTAAVTGRAVGRRAVAPLAEALSRQRRFVADASHELRTPIAQVHTRAQLMARRAASASLPVAHRTDLDRLIGTTRLLGEVVDDVLLSARLAARPADRGTSPVDLAALAEAAVATEADRAAERAVTLTLSRPDGPVVVQGVPSALRRVVSELLTNALAHTAEKGRIEVRVSAPPARAGRSAGAARTVELVVADTGTGFDPAEAERIFDRFHRGAGAGAGAGDGRQGLGLALLREVVAGHGGTVEATSVPGQGARFSVRLPAPDGPGPAARRLSARAG